jgi:hypothetical protein
MSAEQRLLVVLACPPVTTGNRTRNQVQRVSCILGAEQTRLVNLFPLPTQNVGSVAALGADRQVWASARGELRQELEWSTDLLAAWGVTRPVGLAGQHRDEQVSWLIDVSVRMGRASAWTVGGTPRHPSRWHQFVSDKHRRVAPGTAEERLRQVLTRVPLPNLHAAAAKTAPAGERPF